MIAALAVIAGFLASGALAYWVLEKMVLVAIPLLHRALCVLAGTNVRGLRFRCLNPLINLLLKVGLALDPYMGKILFVARYLVAMPLVLWAVYLFVEDAAPGAVRELTAKTVFAVGLLAAALVLLQGLAEAPAKDAKS